MKNKKEEKKNEVKKEKELKEKNQGKKNKRTKTDDYYDEVTKEHEIIEEIEVLEKEEKKKEDNEEKKDNEEQEEVVAKKIPQEKKKLSQVDLILLNLQLIMSLCTLVVGVMFFFKNNMLFWLQLSLGITMLTMGVNNLKIYKRKSVTIMYFLIGVLLIVLAVLTKIGF